MDRETRRDAYSAETLRETEYPMLKGEYSRNVFC